MVEGISFLRRVVGKSLAEKVMVWAETCRRRESKPWGSAKALRWVHTWCVQGTTTGQGGWDELRELKAAVGLMIEARLR